VSSSDNITKKMSNLSISGTAEAGAEVEVFSDQTGSRGSATANGSGSWSLDISLNENVHNITAVATDAAGNSSGSSVVLRITVDTTPPAAPSKPDLDATDDTNINNDDITSSMDNLTFTGTATAGADVTLESSLDGELDTVTAAGGNWTFDSISLSEGTHSVTAKTSDTAGNEAVSTPLSLVIDHTGPAVRTDKYGPTDTVVVVNATTSGNYTTESGVSVSYDAGLNQVTLQDTAGNTTIVPNAVYQGAEAGGLREAITNAVDGEVLYVVAGTYTPAGGSVLINISAGITIKGDGASTIIDNANSKSVFVINVAGKTVTFENLQLNNNSTNANQAMIKSGVAGGTVYLKNITKGTNAGDTVEAYLVMLNNLYNVYYWDSGLNDYKQVQDGVDDWTDNGSNWIFLGVSSTAYWTE
jgi:hypothetical protein